MGAADLLGGYAGRRNDEAAWRLEDVEDPSREVILGCRHHEDGVVLGYADGRARFLDRKALGLGPDDPIEFGDASKSPLLRALSED